MTYEELDEAYARAEAFDRERFVAWCEWTNMVEGVVYDEDGEPYAWN